MAELGIVAAAQALGVSADTVRRRVKRGEIPAHRDAIGRWWINLEAPIDPLPRPAAPTVAPRTLSARPAYQKMQRDLEQARALTTELQRHVVFLEQVVLGQQRQLEERAQAEADLRLLLLDSTKGASL